jgi:hypothetical protein
MRRLGVGLLVLISALALLGSSTSLWTRRHIVNTDVFVAGTERILADPAVSARIESQVVDTIMARPVVQQAVDEAVAVLPPRLQQFKPTVEDGARNLLGQGVHAILTAPQFERLTSAAVRSAQTQLVNGQPVEFTLGQAKALVPAQDRTGLAGQVLDLIPDDVGFTVLTPAQAPRLYSAIDVLKTLWLWLGLLALGLLVAALLVSRRPRRTLRAWAVTTGVAGLILVLIMGALRGPLLGQVQQANVAAVDAVYQGVTASLRSWTLWLVLIMAGIVAVTLLWGRIGIVPAIRRGYRAVGAQVRARRERPSTDAAGAEAAPSWARRVADGTRAFVDGLDLPERLARLAGFLRRNLRTVRWAGVAVGALVLLFWPAPTLSVLIWVAAFVALYIGLVELVLAVGGRAEPEAEPAPVPVTTDGHVREESAVPPAPAADGGRAAPEPAMTPEVVAAMGSKLDLLLRLGDARAAGVLTEEEFTREKAQLLGR